MQSGSKKHWCFTCEFESLISKAKEGRSPLSPIGILSQLQNIGTQLGIGREEDAHEFLRYAVETMQSVCLKEAGVHASGTLEEETTLVGLTFGGYLLSKKKIVTEVTHVNHIMWSQIKFTKCQSKSERQESMMDLSVEIEGNIATLEEALRQFTSTESLDGENKYHCGSQESLESSTSQFLSGTSDKSPIYRLYGVVVLLDIMHAAFSGHHVCYIKNAQNKWFKIDDSTVTPVALEKISTKGAYMLLYARCAPRDLRLIRNRISMPDLKTRVMPSLINGKTASLKSRSIYANSGIARWPPGSNLPEGSMNFESIYSSLYHLEDFRRGLIK